MKSQNVEDAVEKIMLLVLTLLPVATYLNYYLSPTYSRLNLTLFFFIPFIFALFSRKSGQVNVLMLLSFIAIPTIVFITRNIPRFDSFLSGAELSGTRLLAQSYLEKGVLVFPDSHSYFPQTTLLLHFLSTICGFSLTISSIIVISLYILLIALVGLYVCRVILKNGETNVKGSVIIIAVLSVFVSNNLMYTNVAYRYLASPLFLLLLFFMYDRYYADNPEREYNVITLLLTAGVTLGDPTSALLMVPFFLLLFVIGRRTLDVVYALIPLSYLTYSATSYILSIRTYTRFALFGFLQFLQDVARNQFPERVVPWERTISLSIEDAYLTSVGYISLLIASTVIGLLLLLSWIRKDVFESLAGRRVLAITTGIALLSMSALAALTYIGASTQSEVPFSDIRTIAMIFSSSLLTFSFAPSVIKKRLSGNRRLAYIIGVLLILSSLRVIYNAYPKSIDDPIKVVEDGRVGSTSVYEAAVFINDYYKSGGIIADYKILNRLGEKLPDIRYEKRWLNGSTLDYPFTFYPTKSMLIFNVDGVKYPSLYHSMDYYMAATNYTLAHNRIYDNGIVVAARHEEK